MKPLLRQILTITSLLFMLSSVQATPAFTLKLPLVDLPYNKDFNPLNPSMTQSLYFTKGFYQSAHYGLSEYWDHDFKPTFFSIIAFDVLTSWIPLSNAWLHEEWHRTVMGQYGINSYNEVYEMEFFSETISVSDVKDEDLSNLKKNHPHDFIRMHSAGLESQNQLNLVIEKDQFFHDTQTFDQFILISNSINTSAYLYTCASNESNSLTREILKDEGQNISGRDFTGLDCNAWVYDLFRPDEPYADRGTHPSGVGINRYITYSMLDDEEKRFLRKQHYLSYLNFFDPFLFGKRGFLYNNNIINSPVLWNANLKHYLTPFGYSIDAHLYLQTSNRKVFFTLHNYNNKEHYFPGVSLELISLPQHFGQLFTENTFGISVWNQPKDFSFTSTEAQWGGRMSVYSEQHWNSKFHTFIELSIKSKGWYAGELYLNENENFMFGVNIPMGH